MLDLSKYAVQSASTGELDLSKFRVAEKMGAGEAAWEGGKEGITFGLGRKASAALSAGMTKADNFIDDAYETDEEERMRLAQGEFYEPEKRESFDTLARRAYANSTKKYDKAYEDQPLAAGAGEVVGSLAVPVPVLAVAKGTKAGQVAIEATKKAAKAATKPVVKAAKAVKSSVSNAKAGKVYKKLQEIDLLPSNAQEWVAQTIGHTVAPGWGGVAAQKTLKMYNKFMKMEKKGAMSTGQVKAFTKVKAELKLLKAKAKLDAAKNKKTRRLIKKR